MQIGAVIEIAPDVTGALPGELIAEAYEASRAAPIAFVLNGRVRREDVDRVLDPIVSANRGYIHGVLYLDASDDATVQNAVSRAQLVVWTTDEFRERCAARGVRSLSWPGGRSVFAVLTERATSYVPQLRTGAALEQVAR